MAPPYLSDLPSSTPLPYALGPQLYYTTRAKLLTWGDCVFTSEVSLSTLKSAIEVEYIINIISIFLQLYCWLDKATLCAERPLPHPHPTSTPPPSLEAMPSLLAGRHALASKCHRTGNAMVYDHLDGRQQNREKNKNKDQLTEREREVGGGDGRGRRRRRKGEREGGNH